MYNLPSVNKSVKVLALLTFALTILLTMLTVVDRSCQRCSP